MQRFAETLDAFISRLKIILKEFDYGDEKEKQLHDQIVFGCREDSLRDEFFREAALTLQMTIHMYAHHIKRPRNRWIIFEKIEMKPLQRYGKQNQLTVRESTNLRTHR